MSDFFRNLVEDIKDEDTSIAADGKASGQYTGTVDTGSYVLNAVLSGSIYGGVPNNKVTAFAGESSTGKTYFALGVVSQFLNDRCLRIEVSIHAVLLSLSRIQFKNLGRMLYE